MKESWNLSYTHQAQLEAQVSRQGDRVVVGLSENEYEFHLIGESDGVLVLESASGKRCEVRLGSDSLSYDTLDVSLTLAQKGRRKKSAASDGGLISPMPGKVFKVLVAPGDQVEAGSVLLILEAMKMEHSIKAPHAGVVREIFFKEGELVDGGVELATLESDRPKE